MAYKKISKEETAKQCEKCGITFTTTNVRRIYCSHKCAMAFNRAQVRGENPKETKKKICPICGNEFTAGKNRSVYCSRECYLQNRAEYCKEYNAKHRTSQSKKRHCLGCGNVFYPTKYTSDKYCSGECQLYYLQRAAEQYNKQNGTHLSYGQYKALLYIQEQKERGNDEQIQKHKNQSWQ